MNGWREGGARWAVAGLLICMLVFGLALSLRLAGLSGAANAAQIVSLAPLIVGLTGWARSQRRAEASNVGTVGVSQLLRTIADAQGLTGNDLRAQILGWSDATIDAFMDGSKFPEWDFISDFLDVAAQGERLRRELLERRVRPIWKAASDAKPPSENINFESAVQSAESARESRDWILALRRAAKSQRLVYNIQVSISKHEMLRIGLTDMLERLVTGVTALTAERDDLRNALTAWHLRLSEEKSGSHPQTELENLRNQLQDTHERLGHAERLQAATQRRLQESEAQRRLAERLEVAATAKADQALRRLAEMEHRAAPFAAHADYLPQPAVAAAYRLMGDTDRQVGEEVLNRVDDLLRIEAASLSHFGEDYAKIPSPRARRFRPLAFTSLAVLVMVGAAAVYFASTHSNRKIPTVRGMSLSRAEKTVMRAGLSYTVRRQASSGVVKGIVIGTSPPSGTTVASVTEVTLDVSSGPHQVTIPSLHGMNVSQAQQKLSKLGLRIHQIEARKSTLPIHHIIAQNPAPGIHVVVGSQVTVSVSPGDLKVPRVLNEDINRAKERLTHVGFTGIKVVYLIDTNLRDGIVTMQIPASGRVVRPGVRVTLSVVKNPAVSYTPTPIPTYDPAPAPTPTPTFAPPPTPTPTPTSAATGLSAPLSSRARDYGL